MPHGSLLSVQLTESQFNEISKLVRRLCGINLHRGKKELVKARLNKRLRLLGFSDFSQYLGYVRNSGSDTELITMLDALSTNLTSFFRENDHFKYFASRVIPRAVSKAADGKRRLRIWSAGCSSGEEPYSIAMTVCEHIPKWKFWDVGILATDISTDMLARGRRGLYGPDRMETVSLNLRERYFKRVEAHSQHQYCVSDELRKMVSFARLNLMDPWPMRGPFDAIFCRNVMIYFDKQTQGQLINRFWDMLAPGGTMLIGHSESLTGVKHKFRYAQPTIYEKP